MQFLVYRGFETISVTGVQELQALRISNMIAQQLEIEGAKIGPHTAKGFDFTGGLFSGALKGSPMIPIGSGAIDILAEGDNFFIRYNLCFDQWFYFMCWMGIFISAVVYSTLESSSTGIFACIVIPLIFGFGLFAMVAVVRFKRLISSCIKNIL